MVANFTLEVENPDRVLIYSSDNHIIDNKEVENQLILPTRGYFSNEERHRAKLARALHETLGHPSDHILTTALKNKNLDGTHLTAQDVRNSAAIYGPCVPCLQEKM
jgi:hypothetical protein